jgi:uncharacterized protein RhaS with RHS repeats
VAECTGRIAQVYGDLVLGRVEDDLNLYAYVGNDPLDRTDPAGTETVGADWLQRTQALCEASPANLGALADALDYADANFFTPLGPFGGFEEHLAEVPLVAGLRAIAADVKSEGIVYERINKANPAEKPYIGRAKSEERFAERQKEHARNNPDAKYRFKEVDRAEPGQPLRKAEQRQIDNRGGPTNRSNPNGGASNRRNEIA